MGLEQKLLPGVVAFGRLAQSFRVPNMDERIGMGFPTNFDLRTQQSRDWETGAKLRFGNFALQSSYFDMQLTDEIYYDAVNFVNKNLEPTRRRGVETLANWQIFKTFRLFGNVTYTDATFREGPNAGNEVPVVSRWTGNVGVSWNILGKALSWDTVLHYVGERRMDNDAANFQPQIPAHTTVDMRIGGEFDRYFWSAAAQNVFDSKYFDYAIASTTIVDKYNAYTQPGRTFMFKAGVTW